MNTMKLMLTVLIAAGATLLGACNTIEGAGKDVEVTGDKVQDAARNTSEEIDEAF